LNLVELARLKMRLGDLSWKEIEKYLEHDDRLMLILGATEQHGYIQVLADIEIPLHMADKASENSGVLVAPPLNFGCSSYFADYPGTMSLRVSTLINAVEDIVRSVHHQGFKRILIVNGHGGNDPAKVALGEVVNDLRDLQVIWYDWWRAASVKAVMEHHGLKGFHASWMEAFTFLRTADLPSGEKTPFETSQILNSLEVRNAIGDGVYGGPYQVDKEVLNEIFDVCVKDILQFLQFGK
jgi:creatinine amidohydrolase